jgi:hypothetical protein
MGYRALLKNYIRHLKQVAGDHFINGPTPSEALSKRDLAELRLLAAELEREAARGRPAGRPPSRPAPRTSGAPKTPHESPVPPGRHGA